MALRISEPTPFNPEEVPQVRTRFGTWTPVAEKVADLDVGQYLDVGEVTSKMGPGAIRRSLMKHMEKSGRLDAGKDYLVSKTSASSIRIYCFQKQGEVVNSL